MYDQNRTNELIEAADQWYQEAGELLKRLNSK